MNDRPEKVPRETSLLDARLKTPGGPAAHGGYAHFPGTGPEGESCASCDHRRGTKVFTCQMWVRIMSRGRGRIKAPPIDGAALACKYWEGKTR